MCEECILDLWTVQPLALTVCMGCKPLHEGRAHEAGQMSRPVLELVINCTKLHYGRKAHQGQLISLLPRTTAVTLAVSMQC